MPDTHKHMAHGFFGLAGMLTSWIGDRGHDAIAAFAFYGGALVVLLSIISWCITIYRQIKNRRD